MKAICLPLLTACAAGALLLSCKEVPDDSSQAHGGAHKEAERLGVPFLGEVPLHMTIREKSDSGMPVVATEPDGPHAKIYRDIAARVAAQIKSGAGARAAPNIVIEA